LFDPARMSARIARACATALFASCLALGLAAPPADAAPRKDLVTNAGLVGLTITNLGYVGNGFCCPNQPSCEYPLHSHVEHMFVGGLWVGAVAPDGTRHVSTGAQDATTLTAGDQIREFQDVPNSPVYVWSNSQNSDQYDPRALATQHIQVEFDDYAKIESGNHTPLGLKVVLRALSYGSPYADDFVILDYAIVNISGGELRDVYCGFWADTTVGNTTLWNPYDSNAAVKWNFYNGVNGGWKPGDVPGDPNIWMSYEHDADGVHDLATSWEGTRLLGTRPVMDVLAGKPPVAYNAWRFQRVPAQDDSYTVDLGNGQTERRAGKYQMLSNGRFTTGDVPPGDWSATSDWVSLLSAGPWSFMAPNDTIHATFAIVCSADSVSLLANSKVAQVAYDSGFAIPTGPPSPRLQIATDNDQVILTWDPGDSNATDPALRSPEHHISAITGKPDFQGYRVYRFQGQTITEEPYRIATMVAQFDKVDGNGFDTGLPPLDDHGRRRFVDDHLLDGFPYWYSVVAYSAPDPVNGLPEFQSGFNENARLVYQGSAPSTPAAPRKIGVFPNPYRAGSLYDAPRGEVELGRKIWFTGLPARCRIQVFNLAGDLVKTLMHDNATSGQESWDLLSDPVRAIASGLYVYVVEDLATGGIERGKLVIIK
jgi:hypothetical protein